MPKLDKLVVVGLSQAKLAKVLTEVNKSLPKDSKIKIAPVNRRSGDFKEGIGSRGFNRHDRAKSQILKLDLPEETVNFVNRSFPLTKITKKKAETAQIEFDKEQEIEDRYDEEIASGRRAVTPEPQREINYQKRERSRERIIRRYDRQAAREEESAADKAARERDVALQKETGRADTAMRERKRDRERRQDIRRAERERDKKVKAGEAETPTLLTPQGREAGRARTGDAPGDARERVMAANRARVARAAEAAAARAEAAAAARAAAREERGRAAAGGGGAARAVTPVASTTRAATPTFANRPNPNARNPNAITPQNNNERNPNAIIG